MSTATDSLFGFCVLVGLFSYTYSMIETEEPSKHCSSIDINHVCTFSRILRLKDRLLSATMKLSNHLLYKRNSALRFAYMSIITTGWIVYTITIVPDLPNLERIHNVNICIAIVTFTTWTWSLHIVCTTSPGIITPENISKYDNYHYDDILYTNQLCPTNKIRKVARSKYCRMMNEHIPRFDHYCWWIDQSVGEENYRYFLFFLLFHPIMLSYGAWGATNFFIEKLEMHQAREEIDMTYWAMLKHVTQEYPALSIVHFFMIFGALCLTAFFGFHTMLTCRNMTTNEYYKWKVIKKIHTDAQKEYQQAVKDGRAETIHSGKGFTNSSSFGLLKLYENISVGCIGANYLSIRTDLNIPHADDSEDFLSMVEDSDEDSDVSNSINDPGSMPINSYNIGIVGNIHEVLFPRSMRARDLEIKEN